MPLAVAVAGVAAVAAGLAVVAVVVLTGRLRRLERACDALTAGSGAPSFVHAVRQSRRIGEGLRREVDALTAGLADVRAGLAASVRHVGVVRFDAFDDVAGQLSYAVALLDDAGDGVVLSAISGRNEMRSYAKAVRAGRSPHRLSPEELEALRSARHAPAVAWAPDRTPAVTLTADPAAAQRRLAG